MADTFNKPKNMDNLKKQLKLEKQYLDYISATTTGKKNRVLIKPLFNIGQIYEEMGDKKNAVKYFEKALSMYEEDGLDELKLIIDIVYIE